MSEHAWVQDHIAVAVADGLDAAETELLAVGRKGDLLEGAFARSALQLADFPAALRLTNRAIRAYQDFAIGRIGDRRIDFRNLRQELAPQQIPNPKIAAQIRRRDNAIPGYSH